MRDKKLQVFVSSTYTDLKTERQAAVEVILSSGHIPAGMELFSAGDETQMTVIKRWIDESDVYLLLLGGRYGSIEPKTGKSYTQLEYEYALAQNKPLFAIVTSEKALDDKVKVMGLEVIEKENPHLLKEFRSMVLTNISRFWDDTKDIKIAIHETLSEFAYRKEGLVGWVRGDKSVDAGLLAEEIARLTKENSDLRRELQSSERNTQPLYGSLEYSQLEGLLKSHMVDYNGEMMSLFDIMIKFGNLLIAGSSNPLKKELRGLLKYKIIKEVNKGYPNYGFQFTEVGHDFYLKSLVLNKQAN